MLSNMLPPSDLYRCCCKNPHIPFNQRACVSKLNKLNLSNVNKDNNYDLLSVVYNINVEYLVCLTT